MRLVFAFATVLLLVAAGPSGAGSGTRAAVPRSGDEFCCADDQYVSGWISDEFGLLWMEWGWSETDPRALPACAQLGGYTVLPSGRIDTSEPGSFEVTHEVCELGRNHYTQRMQSGRDYYAQVRFLCNTRYPCGGARFILSRAVKLVVTGLPPPPPKLRFRPPTRLPRARVSHRYRFAFCRPGPGKGLPCGPPFQPVDPSGAAPPYLFRLKRGGGLAPRGLSLRPQTGWLAGIARKPGRYGFTVCAYGQTFASHPVCRRVRLQVAKPS